MLCWYTISADKIPPRALPFPRGPSKDEAENMGEEETKNLLKSCAENLLNAVSHLENRPQVSSPVAPVAPVVPVVEEHRRLFGYRPPNNSRVSISTSSRNGKESAPKRCVVATSTGDRISIPVRNTWTRTFVCLEKKNATTAPSTFEKVSMALAGLEEKSICFSKGGNSQHVHEKILEAFPILETAGGYEILRTGERGNRQLMVLSIPPGGYTVPYLKATIASAKGYIRPLQKDLVFTPSSEQEQMQISISPKVSCVNCKSQVPMDLLQKHEETCHGGSSGAITVSSDGDSEESTAISSTLGGGMSASASGEAVDKLSEMFPNESRIELETCLKAQGSLDQAVMALLNPCTSTISSDDESELMDSAFDTPDSPHPTPGNPRSLREELNDLQKNFDHGPKEKLRVNEEDLLNDAITYYKDSDFNPSKRLRIVYTGQPAADTGGVVRQFYTQLLAAITDSFFQGKEYRSPIYNSDTVASGLMKLVGTIIVHSILQGGPGVPIFSPGIYYYLAKGNVEEALKGLTVTDCSLQMKHVIEKIAEADDVTSLDEEEMTTLLSDCGLTMKLTNDNKMRVIRNLIVHDAIAKPKMVLDQLREGLKTLGFGRRMELYPDIFKELFVAGDKEVTADDIKCQLQFPSDLNQNDEIIKEYMLQFLKDASVEELKSFLVFATGSPSLPEFGLGVIQIEFKDTESIFSSACAFRITLPRSFPDQDTFSSALKAVCKSKGKAFSSI